MKIKLENGMHQLTNNEYHNSAGISRSALWEMSKSPYHYWSRYLSPNPIEVKRTPSMFIGEVVHCMVLEPNEFNNRYIREPQLNPVPKTELLKDLTVKLGKLDGRKEFDKQKEAKEKVQAQNAAILESFDSSGKEVVKDAEYEQARAMADSVLKDEMAQSLLKIATPEESIYFTHEPSGLQCKVRPDGRAGTIVFDLKTTPDASYRPFQRSCDKFGYYLQAGMIKRALNYHGLELDKFVFYCVENKEPYATVYYMLDNAAIEYGMGQFDKLMSRMAYCMEKDSWESYETQILSKPNYTEE